jgi:thiol-disulfide isomerase/thioredoxin
MLSNQWIIIVAVGIIGLIILYQLSYNTGSIHNITPKYTATIVNYYATWCPASLRFKPVWDRFMEELRRSRPDIKAVSMVCEGVGLEKCSSAGINSYPSVVLYKGNKQITFEGSRTILNLHEFVSQV